MKIHLAVLLQMNWQADRAKLEGAVCNILL
jgi:hypothetical protein